MLYEAFFYWSICKIFSSDQSINASKFLWKTLTATPSIFFSKKKKEKKNYQMLPSCRRLLVDTGEDKLTRALWKNGHKNLDRLAGDFFHLLLDSFKKSKFPAENRKSSNHYQDIKKRIYFISREIVIKMTTGSNSFSFVKIIRFIKTKWESRLKD